MSRLKLSPNLFLEVNELNRLVKSLKDDGYKLLIRHLIKSSGIAQDKTNSYFKATVKSTDKITINPGIAFDENLDPIILENSIDLDLTQTTSKYWIILSRAVTNEEQGTVSVSRLGSLLGVNTEFTKVLRGQPNFPTRIKLTSNVNQGEYEVVEIISDTSATLVGDFVAENNVKYKVIGTFTPGFQPTEENRFIYEYDSCNISVIESDTKPEIAEGEYIIASVEYDIIGKMILTDERLPYLFNDDTVILNQENNLEGAVNSITSLKRVRLINGCRLQMFLDFGLQVMKYEVVTTTANNIFNILSYTSHFLDKSIPDGIFRGWVLLNRSNMKSVVIDNNIGGNLYISKFDSDIIESEANDFVVVPNYSDIEIEIKLSGEKYEELEITPLYYSRFSLKNINATLDFPIEYGETNVTLRHRMLSGTDRTTPFQDFNIAQFLNIEDTTETLGASSFTVSVEEPQPEIRNYS